MQIVNPCELQSLALWNPLNKETQGKMKHNMVREVYPCKNTSMSQTMQLKYMRGRAHLASAIIAQLNLLEVGCSHSV